ncbi:MAG TPA: hypothetical protein VKB84_21320 [Candidatus Binataceae bacterium]|nr:hypothetical protein [Candidatus Binataceae bacterium]
MKSSAAAHRTPVEPAPALSTGCAIAPISTPAVAVGVDVGEDFLDLAVLRIASRKIEHHRVALAGIEADPLEQMRNRLAACCPDAGRRWLALIDSPRWPLDLDCSSRTILRRDPVPACRMLDVALRAMLHASAGHDAIRLSMFPTPKLAYFRHCAAASACKPHLRSAYRQLFDIRAAFEEADASARIRGGHFTRFMLAGFLTFRAWQHFGVDTLEAYPDLQFRLSSRNRLAPKRAGKAAIQERIAVLKRLRRRLGLGMKSLSATHDQADAEILALSACLAAKQGSLAVMEHPAEGRFLLTFLERRRRIAGNIALPP